MLLFFTQFRHISVCHNERDRANSTIRFTTIMDRQYITANDLFYKSVDKMETNSGQLFRSFIRCSFVRYCLWFFSALL